MRLSTLSKLNIPIICGPTASGKSAVAIAVSQTINSEILSIDSTQVYRDFNIGSAKPTPNELKIVKHHLIDQVDPNQQYNIAQFIKDADEVLLQAATNGSKIIGVGGSSLYLTSLLHGIASLPPANQPLREQLEGFQNEELWEKLKMLDPQKAARLAINDRLRVIRSLEIASSGVSSPKKDNITNSMATYGHPRYSALLIVLCLKRDELYSRINERAKNMIDNGLLEESAALLKKYPKAPPLKSLGYAQCVESIRKKQGSDKKLLINSIAQKTRNYAKRQITFWRNEPKKRGWNIIIGRSYEEPALYSHQEVLELIKKSISIPKLESHQRVELAYIAIKS